MTHNGWLADCEAHSKYILSTGRPYFKWAGLWFTFSYWN